MSKCGVCGNTKDLKYGWTQDQYCSEQCELSAVSRLHGCMPGAGPVPYRNWVPSHIRTEISRRWES